jgi:hypothetical protein
MRLLLEARPYKADTRVRLLPPALHQQTDDISIARGAGSDRTLIHGSAHGACRTPHGLAIAGSALFATKNIAVIIRVRKEGVEHQ